MRQKIFRDFEIQTDPLIPARRPDQETINKKKRTRRIVDFSVAVDHRVKIKEKEKRDKYLNLAWKLKELWNMKITVIPIVHGVLGTILRCLPKGTGRVGNWRTCRDHRNYKIGQNTEKSPGDLRRLVLTQTLSKDHKLTLVWKTHKEEW